MAHDPSCRRFPRRTLLANLGMGATGIALADLLHCDGVAGAATPAAADNVKSAITAGLPHFAPRAKRVIWLFMVGGVSHLESFDPKPELNKYAGKEVKDTPHKAVLESPLTRNVRIAVQNDANGHIRPTLYPLQIGYKKRGQSGIEVSDWFPHVGDCIDDIAVVRSMWTTNDNHGGQLQFHTGRHSLEGPFPTIGSWVHYGLGSENENLPRFVVLGTPLADCCGGQNGHGSDYLGPEHRGIRLNADPKNPIPFAAPPVGVYREEQEAQFDLLRELNGYAAVEYPADDALRARIKSYELAFRMQAAVPESMRFSDESAATRELYGLDNGTTRPFGELCLAARRLAERGVRFVQVYHGSNGGAGAWDAHSNLKTGHANLCAQTDKPIAGLLKDLKSRGLLDETLVVWGTEFGRTPGAQGGNGRDHHPFGFSVWLAGGGVKGGTVHGATDEIGFHAVEHRHYVTDLHATVLHQLGLDTRRLNIPGRKRLEIDYGSPMRDILA
ncbi:DUF1501 domain-containing protein [Humisphaera borealis]|uniref:DUF1501 domain-containing protein n=1 Tax=Humisphaera borealis TaxID=2807512 RepID=A0A7M2WUB5_9BACT|nr:DUF1501 domain-containing protein [Humisphaera borealis]QOV89039.1 DUF1501 domain-containing protein [Humisphaera borealis]